MTDPPEPEEEPRIPCMTDAECDALTAGAICVEWKGARDCTIPCTMETVCDLPAAGGIVFDFLTCLEDAAAEPAWTLGGPLVDGADSL